MRISLMLGALLGAIALGTAGCRGHNPNYRLERAPSRPLDGYTTLVIAPIASEGPWDAKFGDEARRCASVVAERARDYLDGRGVFGEVKLDTAGAGATSLYVAGELKQLNPGSRKARAVTGAISRHLFGIGTHGRGYVSIHFDVRETGPEGGLLMSGACFCEVRGTGRDPMAGAYNIVAGALSDMIADQVPPPPPPGERR